MNPDEAPQNMGLQLRPKLFDIQDYISANYLGGNNDFLQILKEKLFEKVTQHAKSYKINSPGLQ